jgi:hypothetical protein
MFSHSYTFDLFAVVAEVKLERYLNVAINLKECTGLLNIRLSFIVFQR